MEIMNSLPTQVNVYLVEKEANDAHMAELFAALFPDIDEKLVYNVAKITSYIQETGVNPELIPRVVRGVHNIILGTGKGQVILHVQKDMTNVSVRETDEEINTSMKKTNV
jgi:hypothetical protein